MLAKSFASILCCLPCLIQATEPADNVTVSEKNVLSEPADNLTVSEKNVSSEPADHVTGSEKNVSLGSKPAAKCCCVHDCSYIEAKAGYFFFTSSPMSKVYDQGGVDVQVSGAYGGCSWMRIYGSVEYLQKSGYSLNAHQSTSIWEVPLSFGLQPYATLHQGPSYKVSGYLTLGPRYFFAHVHNHSDYVDHSMKQNGLGGFVNLGLLTAFSSHFLFDIFGEYSYCKLHFHSSHYATQGHSAQVGGLTFGAGMGYGF
jgi:hypothetical protein